MKTVTSNPDPNHVSTSFVERQNWTLRTSLRRYTRLSNGFSRKLENHAADVALNYFAYNFIKIHRTLRTSPAMAAGVTHRLWDVKDLVALREELRAEGGKSGVNETCNSRNDGDRRWNPIQRPSWRWHRSSKNAYLLVGSVHNYCGIMLKRSCLLVFSCNSECDYQ